LYFTLHNPHKLKKTFLSYSRTDAAFALKLANDLQQAGANIWIDQLHIRPGEPWDEEIENALAEAGCLLVILSPSSVASDNVLNEINFALEEKKQVLPVIAGSVIRKPFNIRRLQHIDFTGPYPPALEKLIAALSLLTPPVQEALPMKEDLDGRWVAAGLVNPFDKNDIFNLDFQFETMGHIVWGTVRKTAVNNRYDLTKGFSEGTYKDGVISFHTAGQSLVGNQTIHFKDSYHGMTEGRELKFIMQSDRPWTFPAQKFVAKRA